MPEALRYSTVLAIHTLWLAAQSRGIGLGWVSILDPKSIAMMLDAPKHWHFMALLCVGYPETPSDVPELERRNWQARDRKGVGTGRRVSVRVDLGGRSTL